MCDSDCDQRGTGTARIDHENEQLVLSVTCDHCGSELSDMGTVPYRVPTKEDSGDE